MAHPTRKLTPHPVAADVARRHPGKGTAETILPEPAWEWHPFADPEHRFTTRAAPAPEK